MIIDVYGHYTTESKALEASHNRHIAGMADPAVKTKFSDLTLLEPACRFHGPSRR